MKDRSKRVFLRYMKLLLKYKKILIISFILIMINSVLTIILPEVMMRIIDDALPQKDMKLLITLVEAFLMVVILQTVFKFIQDFICSKLGKKVLYDIKNKLINHLFKLDGDYYSNVKVGELLTIIDSDVYTIEQISTNVIFSIISDNVTAVVILIYLIKLQPNLAGIVVILQIVLLVFQLKSSKKLIDNRKEFRKSIGELSDVEEEVISNLRPVILLNLKEYMIKKFNLCNKLMCKTGIKADVTSSINYSVTSFISGITTVIILGVGGFKIINRTMELGELIAFNMYAQRMYTPIIRQIQSNLRIQQVIISLDKIFTLLDEPIKIKDSKSLEPKIEDAISIYGKIQFKDVDFKYSNGKRILKSANLAIDSLKSIAILGESGTGKTSITNLLFRLWQQNDGEILIDDKPVEEYSIETLRENIAIVTQESFIFNDTLLNNLTMGRKDISLEEVQDICKKVCIHDYIMSLPDGYQTVVGYKGDKLSGGQKQRLCIARAFLRKTPIIILDEITSSLDSEIQKRVMEGLKLEMKKRTCIFITHRMELLPYVDDVFVLKEGMLSRY